MSSLPVVGSLKSAYSGKLCKIHGFAPKNVNSARFYVSYRQAITFKDNAAPDNFSPNFRWDKMEFNYTPTATDPRGYFDLTSLDFFAIPMQIESRSDFDKTTPGRQTMTFYTSTPSLLGQIFNLNASMANAFYKISPPAPTGSGTPIAQPSFNPTTDSLDQFARVLGPQTIASRANAQGKLSASPYPSFQAYLQALVDTQARVTIDGRNGVNASPVTVYQYQVRFESDGSGGFRAICSPLTPMTGQRPPQGAINNQASDVQALPADQVVKVYFPANKLDFNVYGASADSFAVDGLDVALIPYSKNSVYANIAGDVSSGLQFGYINGRYGNVTRDWYSSMPIRYPFGAARLTNDGYYNPYAAFLYNLSDSYGFPYTDRHRTNNPLLITDSSTPVMRLTVLPDVRLDAPTDVAAAAGATSSTLNASWKAATPPTSGAGTFAVTQYVVSASDGWNAAIEKTVPATDVSSELSGLAPTLAPKRPLPVVMMQATPQPGPSSSVSPSPILSPIPSPSPSPGTYWPVTPPPAVFTVKAVPGGSVTLDSLKGAVVKLIRVRDGSLVPNVIEAQGVLGDTGEATFNPVCELPDQVPLPYLAPIFGAQLGYRIDVTTRDATIYQTIEGKWSGLITHNWRSGLQGQANTPAMIYVRCGGSATIEPWGN